jgi:hypothetical protein
MNNEMKNTWKEVVLACPRYYSNNCPEGLMKTIKNIRTARLDRNSNQAPLEYMSRALSLRHPVRPLQLKQHASMITQCVRSSPILLLLVAVRLHAISFSFKLNYIVACCLGNATKNLSTLAGHFVLFDLSLRRATIIHFTNL